MEVAQQYKESAPQLGAIASLRIAYHGMRASILERSLDRSLDRQTNHPQIDPVFAAQIGDAVARETLEDPTARFSRLKPNTTDPIGPSRALSAQHDTLSSETKTLEALQDGLTSREHRIAVSRAWATTPKEERARAGARVQADAETREADRKAREAIDPWNAQEREIALALAKDVHKLNDGRKTVQSMRKAFNNNGQQPLLFKKRARKKAQAAAKARDTALFNAGAITAEELVKRGQFYERERAQTTDARGVPTPRPMLRRTAKLDKHAEAMLDKYGDLAGKDAEWHAKQEAKQAKIKAKIHGRATKIDEIIP